MSDDAKQKLWSVSEEQERATIKSKNTAVAKSALQIIQNANSSSQPIIFVIMTAKNFIRFITSRAQAKGTKFLS